jgi:modulator of drug activity B
MPNALLINAHQVWPFAPGRLNRALAERIETRLADKGYAVRRTDVEAGYAVEAEVASHLWADTVVLQTPVYWMGVPWIFKRYMDEVYTAGMAAGFCTGDGRSEQAPKRNYGTGGRLTGKRYMLSLTFNAPAEAFDDPAEPFFAGRSVDDLFRPMHLAFRFFGMQGLPTFACHDVMKDPHIEADFARLDAHIAAHF